MEYVIKNKNEGFYLPQVWAWVMDDLKLNLKEGMLYTMIMNKNYYIWTAEFTAKVLRCSTRTIIRMLDSLVEKDLILKKTIVINGTIKRNIYVALYTKDGRRPSEQINKYFKLGEQKLSCY